MVLCQFTQSHWCQNISIELGYLLCKHPFVSSSEYALSEQFLATLRQHRIWRLPCRSGAESVNNVWGSPREIPLMYFSGHSLVPSSPSLCNGTGIKKWCPFYHENLLPMLKDRIKGSLSSFELFNNPVFQNMLSSSCQAPQCIICACKGTCSLESRSHLETSLQVPRTQNSLPSSFKHTCQDF